MTISKMIKTWEVSFLSFFFPLLFFPFLPLLFLCLSLISYLKSRKGGKWEGGGKERKKSIFHPLIHSLNVCNSQDQNILKPGAAVSTWSGRNLGSLALGPSTTLLHMNKSQLYRRCGIVGTRTSPPI